mmetsp:Transcript_19329/g.42149  ORF Transcript_19329/g.42149 Transcript_19329/m.42149 type:complete len:227 (+) Transcript_19329:215-895(+)
MLVQLPDRTDLANALRSEDNLRGEVRQLSHGGLHIGAHGRLLARQTGEHSLAKLGSSIGHRQGCTPLALLGVDDLCARILHTPVQVRHLLCWKSFGSLVLREQWQNGLARMASNDWNINRSDRRPGKLIHELVGSHAIERRHTNDLHRVKSLLLVESTHSRNHRVDRIDNEADNCVGAILGTGLDDVFSDACIDPQQISAGHSRPPRYSCRYENQVTASQALLQFL